MKFADMQPGMVLKSASITVDKEEMLAFSRRYDPQWFHTDETRAENSLWNGLIASGWMTCSLAMRLAVDTMLHDSEGFGSPGLESLKWLYPVRAGDTLRLESTINSKRLSASKPDVGLVNSTWRLFNQNDMLVMESTATTLFALGQTA